MLRESAAVTSALWEAIIPLRKVTLVLLKDVKLAGGEGENDDYDGDHNQDCRDGRFLLAVRITQNWTIGVGSNFANRIIEGSSCNHISLLSLAIYFILQNF